MSATQVFHSVGCRLFNQIFNSVLARPANLYVGLRTLDGVGGHPADAAPSDTLTVNLAECTATGYARQAVVNDTTHNPESASGTGSLLTLDQVTFTFTGPQNGITHAFIATTSNNAGVLIASAPLAATRNVVSGDTLSETFTFKLTQGA